MSAERRSKRSSGPSTLRRRPTQGRAERTLDTIFEATAQIVEELGEQGLSTNRIAQRAGFSVGTLYQYFPGKEAVLAAMIDRERQRALADMRRALDAAASSGGDAQSVLRERIHALTTAFGTGQGGIKRRLIRLAWRMDRHEELMQAMREVAEHIGIALARLDDPRLRRPNTATLFVMTRAVMGTIRSASLEDSPLLGTPEFEDELCRMAWSLLHDAG